MFCFSYLQRFGFRIVGQNGGRHKILLARKQRKFVWKRRKEFNFLLLPDPVSHIRRRITSLVYPTVCRLVVHQVYWLLQRIWRQQYTGLLCGRTKAIVQQRKQRVEQWTLCVFGQNLVRRQWPLWSSTLHIIDIFDPWTDEWSASFVNRIHKF